MDVETLLEMQYKLQRGNEIIDEVTKLKKELDVVRKTLEITFFDGNTEIYVDKLGSSEFKDKALESITNAFIELTESEIEKLNAEFEKL